MMDVIWKGVTGKVSQYSRTTKGERRFSTPMSVENEYSSWISVRLMDVCICLIWRARQAGGNHKNAGEHGVRVASKDRVGVQLHYLITRYRWFRARMHGMAVAGVLVAPRLTETGPRIEHLDREFPLTQA